ncbi:MAG: leucine--tRNA ligase [Thermoplasmatota archaeon]
MQDDWDLEALTEAWQQKWWEAGLHKADRPVGPASDGSDAGGNAASAGAEPTFFIHFAYPGISGYLHVGHMRGFTYTDVLARYKRATGHNVLFPAGFHASGIPAVAFANDVAKGEKDDYLRDNGYNGDIQALSDPRAVVDYFAHVYTYDYWKKFGFLLDERRNCTTVDEGYQRFIQWQFRKLNDLGYLIQKPHYAPFCPEAGPVAVDKSETDLKQGGSAEINEFIALRFAATLADGTDVVLPCATLRPETIYGVTNIWAHPDYEYHVVRVWRDGAIGDDDPSELWIVSEQGALKAEWQFERAERTDRRVPASDLIGLTATAPITGAQVPVVAGTFVDPMIATGIVMSVPAHAPFDFAAYRDAGLLESLGDPPQIITVEGYDDLPARVACDAHGVTSQEDAEALEAATDQIYSDEFNKGVFNERCGDLEGKRVKGNKDNLRAAFVEADHGRIIRQFSELVVSRAGKIVDVKRIPDQDFIHYADPEWTAAGKAHAATMNIVPKRFAEGIDDTLDWFGDRACVRRGAWLGTPFPFKDGWIIEPIADSTFYAWYYIVSLYVNDGRLKDDDLTDAFFDYVIQGKGTPPEGPVGELWRQVHDDVRYWGPVDVNLGGKEHQTVHFPVYIMNNVALLTGENEHLRPRGIFVNWWVTQKQGAKISKSKGGAEPIPGAAQKYGVDPMRLYYCHVGSPHADIEWVPDQVLDYRKHVLRLGRVADELLAVGGTGAGAGEMDAWLEAAMARALRTAGDAYEAFDLRTVVNELVYAVPDLLRWYQKRGGANADLLAATLRDWAVSLCPIVPHVAEEMYARAGGTGLCSEQPFPSPAEADTSVLDRESYLLTFLEDAKTVLKLADVADPEALTVYTSPAWKQQLLRQALELDGDGKFPMGQFMGQIMQDPEMRKLGKAVQKYAGKLPGLVKQLAPWQAALVAGGDEAGALTAASGFLAQELEVPIVRVHAADDEAAPDHPKRGVAEPLKPGLALA